MCKSHVVFSAGRMFQNNPGVTTRMCSQAQLSVPLLAGARRLLAVLLGTRAGLAALLASGGAAGALLAALDPAGGSRPGCPALPVNAEPPARSTAGETAATLRVALAAAQAVDALVVNPDPNLHQGFGGGSSAAAAVRALAETLGCEQGRRAVVQALAVAPGALARLLNFLAVCDPGHFMTPLHDARLPQEFSVVCACMQRTAS